MDKKEQIFLYYVKSELRIEHYSLNKEQSSYNGPLDGLRLSLRVYNIIECSLVVLRLPL